jgi:hypothetical protein
MQLIQLPDPGPAEAPPFRDPAGAAAWLAQQPLAQPAQMQAVLQKAVAAVDASDIPAAVRVAILDRLRGTVIVAQTALEPRYSRKPLPLPGADADLFFAARKLWRTLAVAYLRTVPDLPPAQALVPLHRGAVALRVEQYAHFLAAYQVPGTLLQLLLGVVNTAEALGVHHTPLADPDYKHISESHVAGHGAWAFLLQFSDPYRLSMAQLAVANRAFSRWRELALFRAQPDDSPRARDLQLSAILGEKAGSRWLDVRPVARKIRNRIEALEAGESPEALKLGRELSPTACIRLLRELDEALRPGTSVDGRESGSLNLVFGAENIYALLAGERLNPAAGGAPARKMDHQRLAVFGFDNAVTPVGVEKGVQVSGEAWQAVEGTVSRAPDTGVRLLSPCLVAWGPSPSQKAKLGVLNGLQIAQGGRLQARLQWYPFAVQAASVQLGAEGGTTSRVPVFILGTDSGLSLLLPAGAIVRPNSLLVLEGEIRAPVMLGEVLERGSDFVRYAATPQ